MKIQTSVKAGGAQQNHNETQVRLAKGLKVQTSVKAGNDALTQNHNETQVRLAKGLKVQTGVKAGALDACGPTR
jgi:hypothetical protein